MIFLIILKDLKLFFCFFLFTVFSVAFEHVAILNKQAKQLYNLRKNWRRNFQLSDLYTVQQL